MKALKILVATALMAPALAGADTGPALSADGGRYVFGQISDFRRDKFMLDTATGRLWTFVCVQDESTTNTEDCKSYALRPVEYWDWSKEDPDFKSMPSQATSPAPAKPKK